LKYAEKSHVVMGGVGWGQNKEKEPERARGEAAGKLIGKDCLRQNPPKGVVKGVYS